VCKALRYCLRGPYRQWDSNWERMLEDGTYMSDDEFLSNFCMDRLFVMQSRPSIEERWNISGRIRKVHGFINCIGLINGTLFPLALHPW